MRLTLESRKGLVGLALVVFTAVYLPLVWHGWLGLDDEALVKENTHLGHGWNSYVWGVLDVQFGRRWTPLLWTIANFMGRPEAFRAHVLVFVIGALDVVLYCLVAAEFVGRGWAWLSVGLFVLWPSRLEVFGWEMGFVYGGVLFFILAGYLVRRSQWALVACMTASLLTYPIAAGAVLLACWWLYPRRSCWVLAGVLLASVEFQMALRSAIGFVPWHPRFDAVWLVLPHYALVGLWPFEAVPIFPAVFYPLIPFGLLVLIFCWVKDWRSSAVWTLLLSPVLLSAVTESFWLGARYAMLPEAYAALWVGRFFSRGNCGRYRGALVLLLVLAASLTASRRGQWLSSGTIVDAVYEGGLEVGRDLRFELRRF